jgi:hypothetical protein
LAAALTKGAAVLKPLLDTDHGRTRAFGGFGPR